MKEFVLEVYLPMLATPIQSQQPQCFYNNWQYYTPFGYVQE